MKTWLFVLSGSASARLRVAHFSLSTAIELGSTAANSLISLSIFSQHFHRVVGGYLREKLVADAPESGDIVVLGKATWDVPQPASLANEVLDLKLQVLAVQKENRVDQHVLNGTMLFDLSDEKIGSLSVAHSVEAPHAVAPVETGVVPPVFLRRE